MSWTTRLCETYDNLYGTVGNLEPISHQFIKAQIEITIYNDGKFAMARELVKEEEKTLSPVTESSAGRSSGIAPHALADTLSYIAKDFVNYIDKSKKKDIKTAQEKNLRYMQALEKWKNSEFNHPKLDAIYRYLENGTVIKDLIKSGIVTLGDDGYFSQNKIGGNLPEKAVARFVVLNSGEYDETWKDKELIDNYSSFYIASQEGRKSTCYISGLCDTITENNPKNIVNFFGNAKLISANDSTNYTYRGRFSKLEEAMELGFSSSQKMHLALRWLCANEGIFRNGRMYVAWNPEYKKVPALSSFFEDGDSDNSFKEKLDKSLKGYSDQFTDSDIIVVIALDAATTGRLSVVYYNEFMAGLFFEKLAYWAETSRWELYGKQKSYSFFDIVRLAFGSEHGAMVEVDDKIAKNQTDRLLKCMLDGQKLSYDFVYALLEKSSRTASYSKSNYEKVLSCACAMIRKYHIDWGMANEKEIEMILDRENRDRSYLFGRLLAVYEQVEKATYGQGFDRETNASRLMAIYVNRPQQTWHQLEIKTKPYLNRLKIGSKKYYEKLIEEIVSLLKEEDTPILNTKLNENYLIGYYLQRQDFYKKHTDNMEEN